MGLIASIRPSITIGGRVFTDLDNLLILSAVVIANTYATAKPNTFTSTGYSVPTLTTFDTKAFEVISWDGASNGAAIPGYGDNDVGENSGSEPTNPVYVNSSTAPLAASNGPSVDFNQAGYAVDWKFKVANKFIFIKEQNGGFASTFNFYGFENPV